MSSPPPSSLNLPGVAKQLEQLPTWGKSLVIGGATLAALYLPYSWYRSRPRETPLKKDFEKGVVYLYQYPRCNQLPSLSAACLKLETWLRISDVPYENMQLPLTVRGLDGSVPFVELDGEEISHSSISLGELRHRLEKDCLEEHLSDEQKASSAAFDRLVDRSLSSSHRIFRAENADKVISLVPSHVFGIFAPLISRYVLHNYLGQCARSATSDGLGSYTREQKIAFGEADLRTLSKYLGAKHYFNGFKPTTLDATIFGLLAQIAYAPYESSHGDLLKGDCANLLDFVERIRARFWPDWKEATTTYSLDSNWKKRPILNGASPRRSLSARQSPKPSSPLPSLQA